MLKWAKPNQRRLSECNRRVSECSDASFETCSNLSSDSSESGITVPIRYHERRTSRPKSLALSSTDVLDLDQEHPVLRRVAHRADSIPMVFPGCSRGTTKRHSMIVSSTRDRDATKAHQKSLTLVNHNNNVLKISTTQNDKESGVLRISTADCDKPKSRNSFWKNLRAKAQGKKSEKKLEKANSMSNLPDVTTQSTTVAYVPSDPQTPTNDTLSISCPSPVVMRRQQNAVTDAASNTKNKANVIRRRSFKLIKKQNENKKPKQFSKLDNYPSAGSPDSGISSREQSVSSGTDSDDDVDSPLSPITPINTDNVENITGLRQQFTSAVLQYLNERLEKKGYDVIKDRSSTCSSIQSDDGASDIFCYDTDTVARRPSHEMRSKQRIQATH
ncbi:uncharacterized protein [Watersipora subatra]|uniref:uncharacterized protein n=1 Tax=Watersipora subatra TaxID=2589382 RepID=UPI00355AD137